MKKILFVVANILAASPGFSQVQSVDFNTLGGGDPRILEVKGGGDPYTIGKKSHGVQISGYLGGGGDPFIEVFNSKGL